MFADYMIAYVKNEKNEQIIVINKSITVLQDKKIIPNFNWISIPRQLRNTIIYYLSTQIYTIKNIKIKCII